MSPEQLEELRLEEITTRATIKALLERGKWRPSRLWIKTHAFSDTDHTKGNSHLVDG